ncbi:plasmid replication protein [Aneurinibacillus thermoaerophilus]|uniref:plasmid replication protein n=1 Tax=Aneurinibacillus thermoaerophilus TaxID=143495 RepID=UPI002E23DC0B|nr:plasmid replication protein [Aneurinibacillus thermoaerophilus]
MESKVLDNVVDNFMSDSTDMRLSLKFGFLGLGMGGCSIANECAAITTKITNNKYPYTAILINTNLGDLEKLPNIPTARKVVLKGYEKGAGRKIEIGEKAFKDNIEQIRSHINEYFADREFVWVVCGLGGGTGTGSVLEAVRLLYQEGFAKRVGLILTLPRDNEGRTVLENAIERLNTIAKAMKNLGSILLVDNEKLHQMFFNENQSRKDIEYLTLSNKFIAQTLHEINTVTASLPYGGYHFDSSELANMLTTPGVLSFSRCELKEAETDADRSASYLPEFKRSVQSGMLSDGHKLSSASRAAVSVIAKKSTAERVFTMDFVHGIEQALNEFVPLASEKPVATYTVNEKDRSQSIRQIYIYSIFGGLQLPPRVTEIITKYQSLVELEQSKEADEVLAALSSFKIRKKEANNEVASGAVIDPFAVDEPEEEKKNINIPDNDPFADLD